jgi:hypothetical protein
MRRLILAGMVLVLLAGCMNATTPTITMAKDLPTPTYHSEWDGKTWNWNATHPNYVNDGPVTRKFECLLCHDPHESCDRCHRYVGAKLLFGGGASEH